MKMTCQHNPAQSFVGLCSEWVIMVSPHPWRSREMLHQVLLSLVTALIYFNRTFKINMYRSPLWNGAWGRGGLERWLPAAARIMQSSITSFPPLSPLFYSHFSTARHQTEDMGCCRGGFSLYTHLWLCLLPWVMVWGWEALSPCQCDGWGRSRCCLGCLNHGCPQKTSPRHECCVYK